MRFSGRYSATTYETSPFDSTRAGGGISFEHQMSDRSSLSFLVDTDEVDYDEEANVDFTREDASMNYTLQASRTDIDATLGYTRMDIDDGSEKTGPLVDIEVRRAGFQFFQLNLRFGTQLSDAAEALRNTLDSEDLGSGIDAGDGSGVIATALHFREPVRFAGLAIRSPAHVLRCVRGMGQGRL